MNWFYAYTGIGLLCFATWQLHNTEGWLWNLLCALVWPVALALGLLSATPAPAPVSRRSRIEGCRYKTCDCGDSNMCLDQQWVDAENGEEFDL